jgi:TatD DNase family protein
MHCFNGGLKLVEKIIKNRWFLTIPANVTFSENFQKIVEKAPLNQLLCETDSPYLHPIKGKKDNEPANVIESYRKIAEIKRLDLKEVEEQIEQNFKRLFG